MLLFDDHPGGDTVVTITADDHFGADAVAAFVAEELARQR